MKKTLLAIILAIGCSSEPTTIPPGTYPPDAGETGSSGSSSSSSGSSSGSNCMPIAWHYGPDRFCEQCVCPKTPCKTHALGEDLIEGVCDEKLNCSAKCHDPLWIEMFDGGQYKSP